MSKKDLNKARQAVRTIAEKENISTNDVRREMKAAIFEAMRNPDPAVRSMWESMPCKGDVPEPEELIAWLTDMVKEKLKN